MYFDKTADQLLECKICGDDTTLHCMRCHKPYCSKACQRLDWNGVGCTETKQKAEAYQKAQACQKARLEKNRYGDHKVICYKVAGPYNKAFIERMMTPPPSTRVKSANNTPQNSPPTTPPSQAGRHDFEVPATQPVSSFNLYLMAPFLN